MPLDPGSATGTAAVTALLAAAAVLALGTTIVFPFEMDTIVVLSGNNHLVATHYGLYNTVCGVGILLGNLGTGWALDLARSNGLDALPWLVLIGLGILGAVALRALRARDLLPAEPKLAVVGGRHRARKSRRSRAAYTDRDTYRLPQAISQTSRPDRHDSPLARQRP